MLLERSSISSSSSLYHLYLFASPLDVRVNRNKSLFGVDEYATILIFENLLHPFLAEQIAADGKVYHKVFFF